MILITGGLGFLGPHVARALLDLGHDCVLTRHLSSRVPVFIAEESGRGLFIERLDLADRSAVLALGDRYEITGIVHLAGRAFGGEDPLGYVQNSSGVLFNILEAAGRWRVHRVGLASTIGVYAGAFARPGPLPEDLAVPLETGVALPVPAIKRSMELLAGFVGAHADFEVVSMRLSAIWGPLGRPQSAYNAAPALIHAASRGTELDKSPRQQNHHRDDTIDMCYVKDCARAIALLQTADPLAHATYNVGGGRAVSNAEVVEAIKQITPDSGLTLPPGRDPHGPANSTWLDISRLRHDTGFTIDYPLPRAVEDYLTWLKAGHDR